MRVTPIACIYQSHLADGKNKDKEADWPSKNLSKFEKPASFKTVLSKAILKAWRAKSEILKIEDCDNPMEEITGRMIC